MGSLLGFEVGDIVGTNEEAELVKIAVGDGVDAFIGFVVGDAMGVLL